MSIHTKFKKGDIGYKFKYSNDKNNHKSITGYECRYCSMSSSQLLSHHSLISIYKYYLGLSFPYATCPNSECDNHNINLFESFKRTRNPKSLPYRSIGEYRAVCRKCKSSFYIGSAKSVSINKQTNNLLEDLYLRVISKTSVSSSLESLRKYAIEPRKYYSHLKSLSATLRDYQSLQLSKLLNRKSKGDDTAYIYTDVMDISLQQKGDSKKEGHLYLFVTVLKLDKSYFILALHPTHIDESITKHIDPLDLFHDTNKPKLTQRYDYLQHESKYYSQSAENSVGIDGYYTERTYGAIAHFMVVKKLMARFDKINIYIDSEKTLFQSAGIVFNDDIKEERVDIVLFQHNKGDVSSVSKGYKKEADADIKKAMNLILEKLESDYSNMTQKEFSYYQDKPRFIANQFRKSIRGANSKHGEWAWLDYPRYLEQYKGVKTLWYTHRNTDTLDKACSVLQAATLQPVDSSMNAIRSRVSGAGRPSYRAKPNRSYRDSYYEPSVVMSEIWIYLFERNYRLRNFTKQKNIPAVLLGLLNQRETEVKNNTIFKFRLNFTHAKEISKRTYLNE